MTIAIDRSKRGQWWRRLAPAWAFTRASPTNMLGVGLIAVVVVIAIIGPALAPFNPDQANFAANLQAPSWAHPFGTDEIGRDMFSRVIAGAQISLEVAAIVLCFAVAFGTFLGAIAGYLRGWVDEAIMRLTDLFLGFPGLILAAAIAATIQPELEPHDDCVGSSLVALVHPIGSRPGIGSSRARVRN